MNIILSGFKTCGKSTISKELALKYNYFYIDVDNVILKESKYDSITKLFHECGNDKFRQIEHHAVIDIQKTVLSLSLDLTYHGYVIALGGGTIINPDNFKILKQIGKIIFLNLGKDQLLKRISNLNPLPELFKSKGVISAKDEKFQQIFEQYFTSRYEIYLNTSDIVLDVSKQSVDQTVELINKMAME